MRRRAVGADEVAEAFAAAGATVRRNGSRGMLWLEPLVEVETDAGRIGYAAVRPQYAGDILAGNHVDLGVVEDHPWLAGQHRVTFTRVGRHEPTDLAAYRSDGGTRAWSGPHPRPRRRRRRGHHLGPAWTRRGRLPHGIKVGDRPQGRE